MPRYTRFPAKHVRVGDTVVLRDLQGVVMLRDKVVKIRTCRDGHILWETEHKFWQYLGCSLADELVEVM